MVRLISLKKDNYGKDDKGLNPRTKSSDRIVCDSCGKGIWIPLNPDYDINHGFTCSNCGAHAKNTVSAIRIERRAIFPT